jgi:aminoglycoside phosphotransferase (APT) family kinase protein
VIDAEHAFREAICAVRPDLADLPMTLHTAGWDSDAVEMDGVIFKFPKRPEAIPRLRKEARILALVRPRVPLAVPDMRLHEAPMLFSEHAMIPGQMIETPQYEVLNEVERNAMAATLAAFYAALHAIPVVEAAAAGAEPNPGWPPASEIMKLVEEKVPSALHGWASRALAAYEAIPQSETTFCYYDGHGWNMAFDHRRGVLNGVYDFADAGLGPRAKDLCYTSFISADLTGRLVDAYERVTGLTIDRREVALYTAVQRLAELAAEAKAEEWFVANVVQWHDYMQGRAELRV